MGLRTKQKSAKVIAVDFDGAIVEHRFPDIGMECPGALSHLHRWQAKGIKLILWTMRDDVFLENAVEWCRARGLEFDAVNEGIGDREWTTSNKAYADIYVDDMAIGCPMIDSRRMVDWSVVGPMVDIRLGLSISDDLLKCPLCKRFPKLKKYSIEKDRNGHMYDFDRMFYECELQKCAFQPKRLSGETDEERARFRWNEFVIDVMHGYTESFVGGGI